MWGGGAPREVKEGGKSGGWYEREVEERPGKDEIQGMERGAVEMERRDWKEEKKVTNTWGVKRETWGGTGSQVREGRQ